MVRAGDAICSWSVLTCRPIRACGEYASGCSRSIDATDQFGARAPLPQWRLRRAGRTGRSCGACDRIHRRPEMVRARHHVRDDLGLGWIGHRRFEDADDGRRCRTETDRLANHCRIAVEHVLPERCVSTAAPAAPGPSSAAPNSRPSIGRSPITSKNDPLTTPALTRRGSIATRSQRERDGGKIAECGNCSGARLKSLISEPRR